MSSLGQGRVSDLVQVEGRTPAQNWVRTGSEPAQNQLRTGSEPGEFSEACATLEVKVGVGLSCHFQFRGNVARTVRPELACVSLPTVSSFRAQRVDGLNSQMIFLL